MRGKSERNAYQGNAATATSKCGMRCGHAPCSARKPYADDQVEDRVQEKKGMSAFDNWATALVTQVEK